MGIDVAGFSFECIQRKNIIPKAAKEPHCGVQELGCGHF